jgi:hypothetical protein
MAFGSSSAASKKLGVINEDTDTDTDDDDDEANDDDTAQHDDDGTDVRGDRMRESDDDDDEDDDEDDNDDGYQSRPPSAHLITHQSHQPLTPSLAAAIGLARSVDGAAGVPDRFTFDVSPNSSPIEHHKVSYCVHTHTLQ